MSDSLSTLAVLGGTGALGNGLAKRWARAGYPVIIGSRAAARAVAAAEAVAAEAGAREVRGMSNRDAADAGEIVVLTVPFANQRPTLEEIKPVLDGKILLDVTVPLVPPRVARVQLPPEGCAGIVAQDLLGDGVRVVSAFQTVSAAHLADLSHATIACDVLVCGNDPDAREAVVGMVEAAGMKGWHAGTIANAAAAEALTSVLIFINRRYKIDGAGIRITGTPGDG